MTLTTVGYGDIVPITQEGKIFTMIYIFVGLGIILSFVNTIANHQVKHQTTQKNMDRVHDIVKKPLGIFDKFKSKEKKRKVKKDKYVMLKVKE
jgi:voltage-gated potassium channel Kch